MVEVGIQGVPTILCTAQCCAVVNDVPPRPWQILPSAQAPEGQSTVRCTPCGDASQTSFWCQLANLPQLTKDQAASGFGTNRKQPLLGVAGSWPCSVWAVWSSFSLPGRLGLSFAPRLPRPGEIHYTIRCRMMGGPLVRSTEAPCLPVRSRLGVCWSVV